MPGPLQVIAVSFGPGADFEGRVLAEVDRLQGRGVLRLLDVLFVAKQEDGTIRQLVVGDDEDFGALLASVVPLDGAGLVESSVGDGVSGFDPGNAWALAESLRPGNRSGVLAHRARLGAAALRCDCRDRWRLGGRGLFDRRGRVDRRG